MTKPILPKGWRRLRKTETILSGDKYITKDSTLGFKPCRYCVNRCRAGDHDEITYIRRKSK